MTEWLKRRNIRRAPVTEIDKWLEKENKDSMDYAPMCHVRELLQNNMSPWQYILKTRETHFIDDCALISYRFLNSLAENEK